jgi:hypothetical protein
LKNVEEAKLEATDVKKDEEPQAEEPAAEAQPEEDAELKEEKTDQKVEEAARKTFITGENKVDAGEYKQPFIIHDLLIPGGKTAKLARIPDITLADLRISELLFRFKFREPTPVILLIGGWGTKM